MTQAQICRISCVRKIFAVQLYTWLLSKDFPLQKCVFIYLLTPAAIIRFRTAQQYGWMITLLTSKGQSVSFEGQVSIHSHVCIFSSITLRKITHEGVV